jgi:hypothetical protein
MLNGYWEESKQSEDKVRASVQNGVGKREEECLWKEKEEGEGFIIGQPTLV